MTATSPPPSIAPADPALDRAVASVAARAGDLDAAHTGTRIDLAALGQAGLLGRGLGTDLPAAVEVLERLATRSLAVAFSAWAQRMSLEYLWRAPSRLRAAHLEPVGSGTRTGVTAMAAGFKHVAGVAELPLIATPTADGYRVSGPIHWATNVYPDSLIVLPARTIEGRTLVAVVDADAPGVTIRPEPALIGLGSTASTSLILDGVAVAHHDIVSDDLYRFCREVRPTFLLLQTSFCVGAASASIDAAAGALTGLGEVFAEEHAVLAGEHGRIRNLLYTYASNCSGRHPAAITELRLHAAQNAVAATRLESTLAGGAGSAPAPGPNRRFREAAFLPIQSPSEGQLRWELAQSRRTSQTGPAPRFSGTRHSGWSADTSVSTTPRSSPEST